MLYIYGRLEISAFRSVILESLVVYYNRVLSSIEELYDTIVIIETIETIENIDAFAEQRFIEHNLKNTGTPELNALIVYARQENELRIVHLEKGKLSNEREILTSDAVSGEIAEGNFGTAFQNIAIKLQEKIASILGEEMGTAEIEFTIDPRVFEPPSSTNPFGRSLSKEFNPYNDGIVTEYDPLVCALTISKKEGKGDYLIIGEESGTIAYGKVDCVDHTCKVYIAPRKTKRGELLECTMTYEGQLYSDILTVARYHYYFIPVNSVHSMNDIYSEIVERYDYYTRISEVNDRPHLMGKMIYLRERTYSSDKLPTSYSLSLPRVVNDLKKEPNFQFSQEDDVFVIVSSWIMNRELITALSHGIAYNTEDIIAINENSPLGTLAHELGHIISDLCDEFNFDMWQFQNGFKSDGCPNPFPTCCQEECDNLRTGCCGFTIDVTESLMPLDELTSKKAFVCAGMPYDFHTNPHPTFDNYDQQPKFSIMTGAVATEKTGYDNAIYPEGSTCPLRGCE